MWWKDRRGVEQLGPHVVYPLRQWRDRQEEELELAALVTSYGLLLVLRMTESEVWQRGLGEGLVGLMESFKDRYRAVQVGAWGEVPREWGCDEGWEIEVTQGVSQGCPGLEYEALLVETWVRVGAVVELLEGMGRLMERMDQMGSKELYGGEAMPSVGFYVADLVDEWGRMEIALEDMREGTSWYGLPVAVRTFDPDW